MRIRASILLAVVAISGGAAAGAVACSNDDNGDGISGTFPTEPPPDAAPPAVDAADAEAEGAADAAEAADAADAADADASDAADAADASYADAAPPASTFTAVYTTVIAVRCAPCHTTPGGTGITEGYLDMTSQATAYAELVNISAIGSACVARGMRVAPGSTATSILYLKIDLTDRAPCGSKMPLGGPPLSQAEVDAIGSWITAGAPND